MRILLSPEDYVPMPEIVERIGHCLASKAPFSLIRLGDGELIVLSQELFYSMEWIAENVPWGNSSSYCGIQLPNLTMRNMMIDSIARADMVGVFADDELTHHVLNAVGIQPRSICYAFQNVYMPMYKPFVDLIRQNPPLLVGRPAEAFAGYLNDYLGVVVPGIVPINSFDDIDRCISEMAAIDHDWSLVSAGCNAAVICTSMADYWGKVSIDFGHAPDNAMSSQYPEYWLNVD